jgi:uncharacterized membrane protein HdeD (DUF308 family)
VFRKILNYISSGATSVAAKYALRASVAIPFLLAFGFGIAGVAVLAIDAFGYRDGYFLLAAGFGAIGVIAAFAVWLKERRETPGGTAHTDAGSFDAVASSTVKTAKRIPGALARGTSEAPSNLRSIADLASRNWPLVVLAGIALLLLGGSPRQNRHHPPPYNARL